MQEVEDYLVELNTLDNELIARQNAADFVQAEDGIRDRDVTGVQTCALPICSASCRHTSAGSAPPAFWIGIEPLGNKRAGCSFSQPRLTTMACPPKLGFRLMLRSVRIGTMAPGASIATPQP